MYGKLTNEQIDEILYNESIGRIGCEMQGKMYIFPTNFVYDGEYIHANALDGSKLHMMRTHPQVCFQVDRIQDSAHWHSVLTWGEFQEIKGEEAARTAHLLSQQFVVMIASGHPLHEIQIAEYKQTPQHIIVYRIYLTEKTGRFEYS